MIFSSVVTTFLLLVASTDGFSTEEYLSARCKSRCITLESRRVNCTSATCRLCIKPCDQQVNVTKDCVRFCGTHSKKNAICIKSCKFFKKLHKKAKKPGMCPAVADTRLCGSQCNIDSDCPDQQKCCGSLNCAGNRTCHHPVLRRPDNSQRQRGSKTKTLPPVVRGFTVAEQRVMNGKCQIHLLWKPPLRTAGLQVHRYKLFWSKRLDSGSMMQKLASLRVHHITIPAGIHKYTLQDLQCQTNYMLELQVVYQQTRPRIRSKKVYLLIRTPSKESEKVQEDPHKGNAIRKNRWRKRKKLPSTERVVTEGTQSTSSHRSPTNGPFLNVAVGLGAKESGASQTVKSHILLVLLVSTMTIVLLQGQILNHIFYMS